MKVGAAIPSERPATKEATMTLPSGARLGPYEVVTPLGFRVRVTHERWRLITTVKHPVMVGREGDVKSTLETPEQVRRSRSDP